MIVFFGIFIPFLFITFIYFGLTKHDMSIDHPKISSLRTAISSESKQKDNSIEKVFEGNPVISQSKSNSKEITSKVPAIDIYKRIHELFDLGCKDPKALYEIISTEDVFGVFYPPFSNTSPFTSCPPRNSLVDYEDITNQDNLQMFRNGTPGAFVFFQHLRKAGGTGFCDLATRNMGQKAVPPYYCMPDNVSCVPDNYIDY